MMTRDGHGESSESRPGWGELAELCHEAHDLLYVQGKAEEARARVPRLERILAALPSDDRELAIVYWEALALVAELNGRVDQAVEHRRREIELTQRLHQLVADGIDQPYVLRGRDEACLEARRKILRSLLENRN